MRTILFRADSSSAIGTGHVMRDLVLASQYSDANIIFATQNLEGNINHKIVEAGYVIETLKSNTINEVIALIKKLDIDLIVIDNYAIDYLYEKRLKEETNVKVLVFDDTYEKHHCDILLNHNISANKERYRGLVPDGCELRCGTEFTLLRDEFLQKFPPKKPSRNLNILIAMGGVDSRELNIEILEVLNNFENLIINIITTTANNNLSKLQEYVLDKKNIILNINTNEVAKLMHISDFAILTPSVTVNEAYFMKLPFIAIKTEENQKNIYEYLLKNRFLVLSIFDKKHLHNNVELLSNVVKSTLVNFIDTSSKEKNMILEWRNNNAIRKWMHNRKIIELHNHLNYIHSLQKKDDRIYFLVKNSTQYLGVVDLTSIKKGISAELGIYTNPTIRGFGKILMYKIIEYAFGTLKLEKLNANVYVQNNRAIELYRKFDFKVIESTKDKNGELYIMELKNENR